MESDLATHTVLEAIKIFIFISFDPELLLLGIYPNEIIHKERKMIYASIFTAVLSNIIEEKKRQP